MVPAYKEYLLCIFIENMSLGIILLSTFSVTVWIYKTVDSVPFKREHRQVKQNVM